LEGILKQQTRIKSDDEMKTKEWNKAKLSCHGTWNQVQVMGVKVDDRMCRSLCLASQIAQVSKEGIRFPW
jgi:hypothetical protein